VRTKVGQPIEAATLGDAIAVAERLLDIRVTVAKTSERLDTSNFFHMEGLSGRNRTLVGITIHRGDIQIFPAYDLKAALLENDKIDISLLAG